VKRRGLIVELQCLWAARTFNITLEAQSWQTSFFDFLRLLLVFQLQLVLGARIFYILKFKQKAKKEEPEKTKKELRLSGFVFLNFLLIIQ